MSLPSGIGIRTSPRVDSRGGPSFQDYWRRTGFEGRSTHSGYHAASPASALRPGADAVSVGGFRQGATTNSSPQTDPYVGTSMPNGTLYYPPTQFSKKDVHRSKATGMHWPMRHGDSAHYFVNGMPVMMMNEPID